MNIDTSGIASLLELQNNLASGGMEVVQWLMRTRTFSMDFLWYKFVIKISNRRPCFGFVSQLAITNPKWQVIHKLRLANFVTKMGGRVFLTVGEAVDACLGAEMASVWARVFCFCFRPSRVIQPLSSGCIIRWCFPLLWSQEYWKV